MTASVAVALLVGFAFGWSLERAGLGSARKLIGQFTLTDFTVFKVMFTALVTECSLVMSSAHCRLWASTSRVAF